MKMPDTFEALIVDAKSTELYPKLIMQLNKDFLLANINLDFDADILPDSLMYILHETIYTLISSKFSDYLNLLYIIDVSEEKVKQLNGSDLIQLSKDVTFLILQREWQKVWFRHTYS